MAENASHEADYGNRYAPLTKPRNDGFEICLGDVDKKLVTNTESALINEVHHRCNQITVKNILTTKRKEKTFIWVTLEDFSDSLKLGLMTDILRFVQIVKKHARVYWLD